jgi:hypothetical protein
MMELKSEHALEELWEKCKTFLLKATEGTTIHKDGA